MEKPKRLEQINLDSLQNICQEYIDFIDNDKKYHDDNDYIHYIFEEALMTIFGKEVWTFVNNRQNPF